MKTEQKALSVSKKDWAEIWSRAWDITVSTLLALIIFSLPANAQGSATGAGDIAKTAQKMTYQIYAGGINAVKATLDVDFPQDDRYSLKLAAHTQGFLGSLVPWNGTFETHGWRLPEVGEQPELHRSVSVWRDEKEIKDYMYSKDGHFNGLKVTEEGIDKSPEGLKDELTQGTVDVLTTALQAMKNVSTGEGCKGSAEIFDGNRRFEMSFRHEKDVQMTPSSYNVYKGKASVCRVEVKPVAGAWEEKPRGWISIQEQGQDKKRQPTLWMASLGEGQPAVPIKLQIKTDYGSLMMHLVEYDNGETKLAIEED